MFGFALRGFAFTGFYTRRFQADSHLAYCFATIALSLLEQLSAFLENVTVCRCLK